MIAIVTADYLSPLRNLYTNSMGRGYKSRNPTLELGVIEITLLTTYPDVLNYVK